jgi:hypothetical protein
MDEARRERHTAPAIYIGTPTAAERVQRDQRRWAAGGRERWLEAQWALLLHNML